GLLSLGAGGRLGDRSLGRGLADLVPTLGATAPARTVVTPAATRAGRGGGGLLAGELLGRQVTLVDPHLDADPAERGAGLVEPVVDVGTQRVQRHPALAVELRAGHLGTAESTGALDPDALGTGAHGGLQPLAHRATEG